MNEFFGILIRVCLWLNLIVGSIDVLTHTNEERPYSIPKNAGTSATLFVVYLLGEKQKEN